MSHDGGVVTFVQLIETRGTNSKLAASLTVGALGFVLVLINHFMFDQIRHQYQLSGVSKLAPFFS